MRRNLLKTHATLFEQLLQIADPLSLVAAGVAAHALYFHHITLPDNYLFAILAGTVLCLIAFPAVQLYRPQRGISLAIEIRALFNAWLVLAGGGLAFLFATKTGATYSRVWAGLWVIIGFTIHMFLRIGLRLTLRALRRRGYNLRHIAIVGAGPLGLEVAARLRDTPWSGFAIRGIYDDEVSAADAEMPDGLTHRPLEQLTRDVEAGSVDQVWIALPLKAEERIRSLLERLREYAVQLCFVPDIYGFNLLHHSFSEIAGLPVINLTDSPLQGWKQAFKTLEDYALSSVILLLTLPLLLVLAAAVKLSSPGPVFYVQERVTWNGNRFRMLKFRSMPVQAESVSGPVWAQPGEQRATPFGAWLRRTSLDELPQFINVLQGTMSIVGPRPERPQFVSEFRKQIPGYMQKHLVKAGITGWAQVNDLRGSTDLAKRIQYDLYYIENWSIWFDLRIMILTVANIFTSRNAY